MPAISIDQIPKPIALLVYALLPFFGTEVEHKDVV